MFAFEYVPAVPIYQDTQDARTEEPLHIAISVGIHSREDPVEESI